MSAVARVLLITRERESGDDIDTLDTVLPLRGQRRTDCTTGHAP